MTVSDSSDDIVITIPAGDMAAAEPETVVYESNDSDDDAAVDAVIIDSAITQGERIAILEVTVATLVATVESLAIVTEETAATAEVAIDIATGPVSEIVVDSEPEPEPEPEPEVKDDEPDTTKVHWWFR